MDSSIDMLNLSQVTNPDGSLLKTSQGYSTATTAKISKFSSKNWMNSGMAFRGEYLTQNILEHPNAVVESILSQVLETSAPLKYFLNPVHLRSLIERASAREKPLPKKLEKALTKQIATLSSTQVLEESTRQAPKRKDTETTEKATHLTAAGLRTLYARRLMPLECEVLQGFPKGWTEIDTEQ